ncbi:MAG: ATP-binding protein [Aggregatilineales bacterium]
MSTIRRSLTWKLTLAFVFVAMIGVIVVGIFARQLTTSAFDRLLTDNNRIEFTELVTAYYLQTGSLDGINEYLRNQDRGRNNPQPNNNGQRNGGGNGQNGNGQNNNPPQRQAPPFALIDTNNIALTVAPQFRVGATVPQQIAETRIPVEINGETVAYVVALNQPPQRDANDEAFLQRITQALIIGVIVAGGVALIAGITLARLLTRPLRDLTHALRGIRAGQLEQNVAVRSKDEIGAVVEAFNQMSAELAHANQLRKQMTADIAHDLRTPLTVISGYLEGLQDGTLSPTSTRFQTMYDEAQHLQHLIEDLRTLSLADSGALKLNLTTITPDDLLHDVQKSFAPLAEQQRIRLQVKPSPTVPAIIADPQRLLQVLGNLISNAVRYTPQGGEIVLSTMQNGTDVQLTVSDTGAGIPPEKLAHIFDRFYRVDESRTDDNGTGLGLAIAKSIVEAHGGSIFAESIPGKGTHMVIRLPAS